MTTISARMLPTDAKEDLFGDIGSEVAAALAADHMHLYFQPVVSLADRSATTLEALPRWDHPDRGVLGPETFIEPARAAGVLEQVERWAISEAMHQLAHWSTGIPAQLSISVNLSTPHVLSGKLVASVRDAATQTGVSVSRLGVEIPEAGVASIGRAGLSALRELSDTGIALTLDQYLGRLDEAPLRQLPISSVKIGREIIAAIPDDIEKLSLVKRTVAIGRELGIGVIATGIENPGQAAALRDTGCRYGQGFLFSVPMPAEVLDERMAGQ